MRPQVHQQYPRQHKRRGAALVEAAVVLPVFFTVVLGILEFGRAMMVEQLITNAAREATRRAIVEGTTNSEIETWTKQFLATTLNVSQSDVSVTISIQAGSGNPNPGNQLSNARTRDLVTVQVGVPFSEVQYISGRYLDGKTLTALSSMRHE